MKTIQTDVLVCGSGCAGIGAALASARNGAKTLLVERAGFTGGIVTAVGLPYWDGICDLKEGRIVVKGIALELMVALGICKPDAKTLDDCLTSTVSKQWMTLRLPNTEEYKLVTDELITKESNNLRVLYHTSVCAGEVKDGRLAGVIVSNKDGLTRIEARQVIDCTGDADVARFSGVSVEKTSPLMPLTLHFRIGNVTPNKDLWRNCKAVLKAEYDAGRIPMFYGPGVMFAFGPNEAYIHAIRVPGDASDAADLTRCEIQARKDSWAMFRAWKQHVPGFENSYYMTSSPFTGVRETYRLIGQKVLTAADLEQGCRFDDAIATGTWYMDRHPNKQTFHPNEGGVEGGGTPEKLLPPIYDIPYRSLVAKDVSNLLVAGRCHSADRNASSSTRVTVTCMAMGEAAGVAAALAMKGKTEVALIDGVKVREVLSTQNSGPFTDKK